MHWSGMRQRRITREDVYRAIETPDETGLPTAPGRIRVRWNKTERHGIDVVYKLYEDVISVVTTILISLDAEKGKPPIILRAKRLPPKRKRRPRQRKRKR